MQNSPSRINRAPKRQRTSAEGDITTEMNFRSDAFKKGTTQKSELLFVEPLSSATMTCCSLLLRACWSDILGWVVGVLPWEVGAAGCFATMLGNDDSWLCVLYRVAWVG